VFPIVVIAIIGGYWLFYDGWQRVSHFSPSNPLNAVTGPISDAVSGVTGYLNGTGFSAASADILNTYLGAIAHSGVTAKNPAAKADYDANVLPKVRAWQSDSGSFDKLVAAVKAAGTFMKRYGIPAPTAAAKG
jgi:hypothetical protein